MKYISVGELRQNPTAALDDIEHGETYIVTRHRREIAVLSPVARRKPVTPAQFYAALAASPVDPEWAAELAASRSDFDADRNPWAQ